MVKVFNIQNGLFFGLLDLKAFATQENLSNKREIETMGKNYLAKQLLGEPSKITYDDKGKPLLENDLRHISISHSHEKLAIIINENESTGIDIELIRDKVLKIKHKFLSNSELLDTKDDVEKLIIYWAAKETLYKIYGLQEVDFIKNLFVNPFTKYKLGTIIGMIKMPNFNEAFELKYQLLDDYVLVYALRKIKNC